MKIKEGTYINPSLVNIDYFWKYIANYTKDDLFKHKKKIRFFIYPILWDGF